MVCVLGSAGVPPAAAGVAPGAFGHGDDGMGGPQKARHHQVEIDSVERQMRVGVKTKDQIVQRKNRRHAAQARLPIGRVTKDSGLWLVLEGRRTRVPALGYRHELGSRARRPAR